MMCVHQIIMLYPFNLYSAVRQLSRKIYGLRVPRPCLLHQAIVTWEQSSGWPYAFLVCERVGREPEKSTLGLD